MKKSGNKKKDNLNSRTEEKFIKTNEDWYPSYPALCKPPNTLMWNPLDHTALKVYLFHGHIGCSDCNKKFWRVSVSGYDDFGMDIIDLSYSTAKEIYNSIVDFTTQHKLKSMGFECI